MLDYFWTEYEAMNFELEAEKKYSEIFSKNSFVVKKRKVTETQHAENLLQKLPTKKIMRKKIMEEKIWREN